MSDDNPQNIDSNSFLWVCWILYILSLMLPAGYYDGYFNNFSVFGFEYLLFGIIGVIDHSGNITWLANPLFILAFLFKRKVIISLILSILALYIAIDVNEHQWGIDDSGTLVSMVIGYYMWLSAIALLTLHNGISLFIRMINV